LGLTRDDQIRADLIARLMCNFVLDTRALADKWQLDFAQYFARSLAQLVPCFEDDLVRWHADVLQVTARGRPWVRIIAAAFDAYLLNQQHSYSKVI
jgi:oxygen-independent coproporphyrinogen-3 oxidase